jgi:DNA-binding beta-propeller fold protein YncE
MLFRLARMAAAAALALAVAAPLAHAATPTAFVYATDSNPKLAQYSADDSGLLAPLMPALTPAVATSAGAAASPDGHTLYVADQSTLGDISQYAIAADGTLSPMSPATVRTGTTPFGVTVAPDGRHVYVANQGDGTISVFAVGSNGALVAEPPAVTSGRGTVAVALSPDGTSAYATNSTAGTISQFNVDPTDGTLMAKSTPTVAAGGAPFAITVSPDGHSVYATNRQAVGLVRQYTVGSDGALTPMATGTLPAGSRPAGILAVDDAVYVSNFSSDTLSRYDADADGALSQTAADVAAPHSPFGMALAPDGNSLYVAGFGDGTIGQYDVADDGTLTAKDPATIVADVRPIAIAAVRAPDTQAPTIDLRTPQDGAQYPIGTHVEADYSCADTGGSGVASCDGDVADGEALDTSAVGTFSFTVVARDGAGNETTVTHSYTVTDEVGFQGFGGPIHDGSVVTAGSVVPIAFSLGGYHGLDVLAQAPSSVRVDCQSPGDPTNGYPAQSDAGLQFDTASGNYTFAWNTRNSWAGTCRAFLLKLDDGSVERLVLRFCRPGYWYHSRRHR